MFDEYNIHIYIISLIVFVIIDYATSVFGVSILSYLSQYLNQLLNTNIPFKEYTILFAGLCALLFISKRDNWLPFLGQTVFPKGLLKDSSPTTFNKQVTLNVGIPNAKVVYWASNDTKNETTDVFKAYGDFSNGGVTSSNSKGDATFKFNEGTGYIVPNGKHIKRHVHYRVMKDKFSLLGRVRTHFY